VLGIPPASTIRELPLRDNIRLQVGVLQCGRGGCCAAGLHAHCSPL